MPNVLYPKFKEGLLQGSFNLLTATVKCMLVKSGYTYSASHQYLSSVSSYDNGRSNALTGKSITNGVFDANDITITALQAQQVIAIVLYIDTGNDATSPLIAYMDTLTGLPFTPNANAQITIQWDDGNYKIFSL